MININKFNSNEEFLNAVFLEDEASVSLVGSAIKYGPKNLILHKPQLMDDDVCLIFKDNVTGEIVFIPVDTYVPSALDTTRYIKRDQVRFARSMGREVVIDKLAVASDYFATNNRYILECDLTADGSFDWTITVNDKVSGGTVSWTAANNPTLDDIVTQLNNGRNSGTTSTYLSFAVNSASNPTKIHIVQRTYTNSTFTLSNNTGGVLTDLSKYCRIDGVQQAETHRTWQAQDVTVLFPNLGLLAASTVLYAENGYDLKYYCGCNEDRYQYYFSRSGSGFGGSDSYVAESSVSARMSRVGFASLNGSGIAERQSLYDKYHGSWEDYMDASMGKINSTNAGGMEYKSYNDGDDITRKYASITTMDFDGSYIPAYPIFARTASGSATDIDMFHVPAVHEMLVFMRRKKMAQINKAFGFLSGANLLSNSAYYWCGAQCNSSNGWVFHGAYGRLDRSHKYGTLGSRRLAYL